MKLFGYFSSVKFELKKVAWATKNELVGSSLVVFVFAILLGLFLWVVDDKILSVVTSIIYPEFK